MTMRRPALNLVLLLTACGGGGTGTGGTTPSPATEGTTSTGGAALSQVDRGAELYAASCAGCHGAQGEGTDGAPALTGDGALGRFATAGDLLQWVGAHMPKNQPGSLAEDEYAAIVAFALSANGVDMSHRVLDAQTASEIALR